MGHRSSGLHRRVMSCMVGVALMAGSLLAVSYASPASALSKASCTSQKAAFNAAKHLYTEPLVSCTNVAATGGKGTALLDFKTLAMVIQWNGTGVSDFKMTHSEGKVHSPKCPAGGVLSVITGHALGGKGAALKRFPRGTLFTESACMSPTKVLTPLVRPNVLITPPSTPTTTTSTTTTSTTTTTTTQPCPAPIATGVDLVTGNNNEIWYIIVPKAFPPGCPHPTGFLSVAVAGCGLQFAGPLADSGQTHPIVQGGETPATLSGINSGLTNEGLISAGCNGDLPYLSHANYSGDSIYTAFTPF